jgi:hypothetical protein
MTYRIGNHQARNLYRGNEYIGVMFDPADAALIVDALEGTPDVDHARGATEALALVRDAIERHYGETGHKMLPVSLLRNMLEVAAEELGVDEDAPSAPAIPPESAQNASGAAECAPDGPEPSQVLTEDRRCGQCGQPVDGFEGEPHTEIDLGRGYLETLSVAYTLKPCGHVYIQAVI